jgi:hypothetical protein
VRTRIAGLVPNLISAPELFLNSDILPAMMLSVAGSAFAGGITNRNTG